MSWSYRITILYVGFVVLIISMVVLAMRQNVDLVAKDYYDQELKYQNKIDVINRTRELSESLSWEVKQGELSLKFPSQFKGEQIKGSIYFFRPSNAVLDQAIAITTDTSGIQSISTRELMKGVYKMQVSWSVNDTTYYNEGIIQVN
jgi:hypothetical protein